jgi:choline dehydrogenase-like flavoprotein
MTKATGPMASGPSTMGFVPYTAIASPAEIERTTELVKSHSCARKGQAQLGVDRLRSSKTAAIQLVLMAANVGLSRGDDQRLLLAPPREAQPRMTVGVCLEYPYSRGSVHVTSCDPTKQPAIDPSYLSHPADVAILSSGIRFVEKVFQEPHMRSKLSNRVMPSKDVDLTDEYNVKEYLKGHVSTEYHPIGTASMGKVVDEGLKVKGVTGLRVIDASVFPSNISGNILATVYAIAEKGADMIKADWA